MRVGEKHFKKMAEKFFRKIETAAEGAGGAVRGADLAPPGAHAWPPVPPRAPPAWGVGLLAPDGDFLWIGTGLGAARWELLPLLKLVAVRNSGKGAASLQRFGRRAEGSLASLRTKKSRTPSRSPELSRMVSELSAALGLVGAWRVNKCNSNSNKIPLLTLGEAHVCAHIHAGCVCSNLWGSTRK